MADCASTAKCPFFNDKMANMPAVASIMKSRYCKGDATSCARYMVSKVLGGSKVPSDLFPSQTNRAQQILAQAAGAPGAPN